MHWVLIPSHYITNPRTLDLFQKRFVFFITFKYYFTLHILGFYFDLFHFPLEIIKRGGDSCYLRVKLINSSISDLPCYIFHRYRIGDFTGDRLTSCWSIPKWVKPSLFYLFYWYLTIWLYVYIMVIWVLVIFIKDKSYTRTKLHLRIGRTV